VDPGGLHPPLSELKKKVDPKINKELELFITSDIIIADQLCNL
jgi:hypothetical protein